MSEMLGVAFILVMIGVLLVCRRLQKREATRRSLGTNYLL